MRLFISFTGKKSRQMEHPNHCINVDVASMKTVYDFLVHVKRKFSIKEHYFLNLWLKDYFIADCENITILKEDDEMVVRVSKLKEGTLNPYPELEKSYRLEEQNYSRKTLPSVPSESDAVQPVASSTPALVCNDPEFFVPRQLHLKPVNPINPRPKINLGSHSVSVKSLNSRKDYNEGIRYCTPKHIATSWVKSENKQNSSLPDAGDIANGRTFVKSSGPKNSTKTNKPTLLDNLEKVGLKCTEVKKGHIKFDAENDSDQYNSTITKDASKDDTDNPMEVDYTPIVRPVYVEPPPLEKPNYAECDHPKVVQKLPAKDPQLRELRSKMLDNVIDAYNRKMELILEAEDGDCSEDEADDESVSSSSGEESLHIKTPKQNAEHSEKIESAPSCTRNVMNTIDPSLTSSSVSITIDRKVLKNVDKSSNEKIISSNQEIVQPTVHSPTVHKSSMAQSQKLSASPRHLKGAPGLNISAVISQLNKELTNENELESNNNIIVKVDKNDNLDSSCKNDHKTQVSMPAIVSEDDKTSDHKESMEDILKRAREHIAKRCVSISETENSDKVHQSVRDVTEDSAAKFDNEVSQKRKALSQEDEGKLCSKEKPLGLIGGNKRPRIDISDCEADTSSGDTTSEEETSTSTVHKNVARVRVPFSITSSSNVSSAVSVNKNIPDQKPFSGKISSPLQTQTTNGYSGTVKTKLPSASSSDETSEDEARIKACIKRTTTSKVQSFGAVWSPKQNAALTNGKHPNKLSSSPLLVKDYPKAKPNKSWCEREPQTNHSQILQKESTEQISQDSAMEPEPEMEKDTKAAPEIVQNGRLVPKVHSVISFKVVDLDENFRPELMQKRGTVMALDSKAGSIKILHLPTNSETLNVEKLSKRAVIFHEGITATCDEEDNGDNDHSHCSTDIKEYRLDDLVDISEETAVGNGVSASA